MSSQENTSILLQSPWRTHQSKLPWRTHQSRPHRRTHQSCYNRHGEHINPSLTGEHINLATQESESSCSSMHHQGRVSLPVVVCCSSRTASPPELPELNVCNMQDPFTKVSRRLQVVRENHKFDLSSGLCPVHHLSAMEPP